MAFIGCRGLPGRPWREVISRPRRCDGADPLADAPAPDAGVSRADPELHCLHDEEDHRQDQVEAENPH